MSGICTAVLVYFLKAPIFVMKVSKVKNRNEIKKEEVGAKRQDGKRPERREAFGGGFTALAVNPFLSEKGAELRAPACSCRLLSVREVILRLFLLLLLGETVTLSA